MPCREMQLFRDVLRGSPVSDGLLESMGVTSGKKRKARVYNLLCYGWLKSRGKNSPVNSRQLGMYLATCVAMVQGMARESV